MTKGMVLVVEDELLIGLSVCDQLEDAGYDTELVSDPITALFHLKSHGPYSALLTDIRMPGKTGWWLAQEARDLDPSVPAVYMSGDSGCDWKAKGVLGSRMIEKPFRTSELMLALDGARDLRIVA